MSTAERTKMRVCEFNYRYSEDAEEMDGKRKDSFVPSKEKSVETADYETVKTDIFAKLINTRENLELLSGVPNQSVLDLSLVAWYFENNDPDGAELPVTNEILKRWNIPEETLFEEAVRNSRTLMGEKVSPIHEVINEMLGNLDVACPEIEEEKGIPMYVYSNLWRWNGALCMLFSDTLQGVAEMLGSNLFVIPSSVHEVILVPMSSGIARGDLDNMVREINRTELKPEDILSDHTYIFLQKMGKVIL